MEKTGWKIIAIIFMILFVIETAWIVYSINSYQISADKSNNCLYNLCKEYPDAYYESNICYCYDYDLLGELVIAKIEYME